MIIAFQHIVHLILLCVFMSHTSSHVDISHYNKQQQTSAMHKPAIQLASTNHCIDFSIMQ